MGRTLELENAKAGKDFRLLARDVNKLIPSINALMNMTMLLEGKSRGVGQLEMRGDRSFLRMFTTPGGFGPTIPVTVQVTSSKNPAISGDTISFTATIIPSITVSIAATGTVQFQIDGSNFGSPVALVNGVATSSTTSTLSTGTHTIQASYSGNDDFFPATGSMTETILIATSVSVTSNPSSPGAGQSVTFTATITPSAATGTVQFQKDGSNIGSAVSVSAGHATSISTTLTAGSHTITAIYSGDSTYAGSTGTLNLTANAFPSAWNFSCPDPIFVNTNYNFSASDPAAVYTGQVRFLLRGAFASVYRAGGALAWSGTPTITIVTTNPQNAPATWQFHVNVGTSVNYAGGDFVTGYVDLSIEDPSNPGVYPTLNGSGYGNYAHILLQ